MKTITKFFLSLAAVAVMGAGVANAQIATLDFESSAGGADIAWEVFGAGAPPAVGPVANPSVGGLNTSANCLKFVGGASTWDGCWTAQPESPWVLDATNCHVSLLIRSSVIGKFIVKLEDTQADAIEVPVFNTVVDQWEVLNFDFSAPANMGATVNKLVMLPGMDGTVAFTAYIDDIKFADAAVATALQTVDAAKASVTVSGSSVIVAGGSSVEIVNISGVTVESAVSEGAFVSKALTAGVYVVKVDGKATKVLVK